jgi:hypothetical protein
MKFNSDYKNKINYSIRRIEDSSRPNMNAREL